MQRLIDRPRPGPAQDPKFTALKRDVKSKQQALGKHSPAKTEADAAAKAAKPPQDDKEAQGKAANAEKMCIVIADADGEPDLSFLDGTVGVVGTSSASHEVSGESLTVARIDLGTLEFPAGLTNVDAVLSACADRGLRTSVKETRYRFA